MTDHTVLNVHSHGALRVISTRSPGCPGDDRPIMGKVREFHVAPPRGGTGQTVLGRMKRREALPWPSFS
jgi:hypothetical protein